jgi:hypothetical protein
MQPLQCSTDSGEIDEHALLGVTVTTGHETATYDEHLHCVLVPMEVVTPAVVVGQSVRTLERDRFS